MKMNKVYTNLIYTIYTNLIFVTLKSLIVPTPIVPKVYLNLQISLFRISIGQKLQENEWKNEFLVDLRTNTALLLT